MAEYSLFKEELKEKVRAGIFVNRVHNILVSYLAPSFFNVNYNMSDDEVMEIIYKFNNLITKYSRINNVINEDLKQEIIIEIYKTLTKNRKK